MKMNIFKFYLLLSAALLFVVGCGGAEEPAVESSSQETAVADEVTADNPDNGLEASASDVAMSEDTAMSEHEEGMAELDETMDEMVDMADMVGEVDDQVAMTDAPAWMTISLTDVRSGESFTLADFAGKTVFVEPMATWCTNCRRQLTNVSQARAELGDNEDIIFVGLSVETTLSNDNLARYTDENGFPWTFAVATPEMLVSLVETFGQSITNPPATPHFIIRPDGSTTELTTGFEGPEEILQNLEAESQS